MIGFNAIPASIRKPGKYFEFNTRLAVRTLPANAQKMLIVAQRLAAGSVPALTATQVFSDAEAAAYFGSGSQAHLMARAAIKANPYLDLTICAMDPGPDAAAAVIRVWWDDVVALPGPGTLSVTIDGVTFETFVTDVSVGLADLVAQINAATSCRFTAEIGANLTIMLTAKEKGSAANSAVIYTSSTVPDMGGRPADAPHVVGVDDFDIAPALAAVFAQKYDIICTSFTDADNLTALRDHLDLVSGPMEQRPGVAVIAQTGSLAAATTLAGTINHGRISPVLLRGTASAPYEVAAAYAAVIAGEEDPARPLNTLELKGIKAPPIDQRLSRTEQESCLANGVTPLEVGPGEKVQIVRAITSYTVDAQGVEDISLLDLTTIRTLDYVRKACRERISLRFPREKLSAKTPPRVRTELLDVLRKLEDLEIVEAVDDNKDGLIVERNTQDPNRLDAKIPTDVVNGLHVFAGRIDLLL